MTRPQVDSRGVPIKGLYDPVILGYQEPPEIEPEGLVRFSSDDPKIRLDCEQAAPAVDLPPRPRVQTVDRPGAVGLTQWAGQDPYEMLVTVRFNGYPSRSVENQIKTLESLGEVAPGKDEPPIVRVLGAVPKPHPNLRWRVLNFSEPTDLLFLSSGKRCRYVTTVHLIQHVTDQQLVESLKPSKAARGISTRTHTVKAGEDDLYDVARNVYGNPMRASDIATANRLRLGARLKVNQRLRLP